MIFTIPRNNIDDAIVTITAGIPTYAIRNPLNAPHNAPAAIPAITPANAGSPAEQHSPVAIEEKIMIDATDTSMSPHIRIKIIPSTSGHTSIPD